AAPAAETTEERRLLDSLELKPAPAPAAGAAPATHQAAPELPGVPQFHVALAGPVRPAGPVQLVYQPRVLALAEVLFADRRKNVETRVPYQRLAPPPAASGAAVA